MLDKLADVLFGCPHNHRTFPNHEAFARDRKADGPLRRFASIAELNWHTTGDG